MFLPGIMGEAMSICSHDSHVEGNDAALVQLSGWLGGLPVCSMSVTPCWRVLLRRSG